MPQYIISERWSRVMLDDSPFVQPGIFKSPTAEYNADQLDAGSCVKFDSPSGVIPNAFDPADVVLIRRVRLWSPLVALGLCGAHAGDVGANCQLWAYRDIGGTVVDQCIELQKGLSLGEWVDVNQTLSAAGLGGTPTAAWKLALSFPEFMQLDSSRMSSALVGTGTESYLKFQFQADIAHTLPAVKIP